MELNLQNIGKVKEATISLNGLTVIAGVNDSGKSTVGKMLFSLIKAVSNAATYDKAEKIEKQTKLFVSLLSKLKSYEGMDTNEFQQIRSKLTSSSSSDLKDYFGSEDHALHLKKIKALVDQLDIEPRSRAIMRRDLNHIGNLLSESNGPKEKLAKEMQKIINAEFLNSICSIGTEKEKSIITFSDQKQDTYISYILQRNRVTGIACSDIQEFPIKDATYVESPLYMHLIDALSTAETFDVEGGKMNLLRPIVNYHVKDLAQKLDAAKYSIYMQPSLFYSANSKTKDLDQITGGHFIYDNKSRSFYWEKQGVKYKPVNVASGIKTFGVMQILLETEAINENKILIWDEPENHLHPQWQIKFAQLLVELSQAGIPIVVSSHSPYFIQGIRYFADKSNLTKYVDYYLAEETEEGYSNLNNVTNDLNRLFLKLAEPMNEIINLGM